MGFSFTGNWDSNNILYTSLFFICRFWIWFLAILTYFFLELLEFLLNLVLSEFLSTVLGLLFSKYSVQISSFVCFLIIPHSPKGEGGILFYLCPSFRPSKIFLVAFFSATIDGRNLIFGHKLHIGTPYLGKRFWTRQIPTSCLPKSEGIISELISSQFILFHQWTLLSLGKEPYC